MNRLSFTAMMLAATLTVTLATTTNAQVRDRIFPASGTAVNCEVVGMSQTEVSAEVNGAPRKFAVNELRMLQFVDEPPELRKVRDFVRSNNYTAARSEVTKILEAQTDRDFIKQDILFYHAFCNVRVAMMGKGDKTSAGGQLAAFVEKYPNNYHYFEAVETLGNLGMAVGKFNLASTFYGKMAQAPWPAYRMRAQVLEARSLLVGGKFDEATARYEQVMKSSLESIEAQQQKLLARVGRAACWAETGKAAEALADAKAIVAKEDSQRDKVLFARAYNAIGSCHEKLKQPKEALLAYLHTDVLFNQDPDAHAEALYHLSKLWEVVKKSDRANRARSLLRERYAGSSWATRQ